MDLFNEYSEEELLTIDIQFLGLEQHPWDYKRGAKTDRLYYCSDENVLVKHSYSYTTTNGNRDIQDVHVKIEWFNELGEIKLTKEYDKLLNNKRRKELNREIRQGRIDHMESEAEILREYAQTLPEPYKTQYTTVADNIDFIFETYSTQIDSYIKRGTLDFETAVLVETDSTMVAILNLEALPPETDFPNGMTVKESIIYQLTGVIP